jgi:hypothetical protein
MAIIDKPTDHFNTVLYTGDNASDRAITGVGFQPDFVWIKNRNNTNNHLLQDSVRGLNLLVSNSTVAEQDVSSAFKSFDSDGFTITEEASWEYNNSGKTYASWNWKAGGTAVSNTAGSIISSVSANTTSGFSVVTWTGTGVAGTVGTGLSVTPKITIVKGREAVTNWIVGGSLIVDVGGSTNNYILLNGTAGMDTSTALYASYNPTTVGVKTDANINGSGQGMVMYCFAEVKGFSKFGSYTGNGTEDDGTFVYLGFKPAWVLFKQTNTANNWFIWDVKRDTFNPLALYLIPNSSGAEGGSGNTYMDYVSNGIKLRANNGAFNGSGDSYIYMAFAEQPFVTSTANGSIPATAR